MKLNPLFNVECPNNKFISGFNLDGNPICTDTPSGGIDGLKAELIFGSYETVGGNCSNANPYTGSCSCPQKPIPTYPVLTGMAFHYAPWDGLSYDCRGQNP